MRPRALQAITTGFVVAALHGHAAFGAPVPEPRLEPLTSLVARTFDVEDGLAHPLVRAIAQTTDGYLWVGTEGGLSRFDGASFVTYDAESTPPMSSNLIRSLVAGRDGVLWVGLSGGSGLARVREHRLEFLPNIMQVTGSVDVVAMAEEPSGAIWLRGWQGVVRLKDGRVESFRDAQASGLGVVLAAAPDGTVWFGSNRSIIRFRNGHFTRKDLPALKGSVLALAAGSDGALWIGTGDGGVLRYRDDRLEAPLVPDPIPGNPVHALLHEPGGALWIGTERGLFRWAEGRLDELPSGADGKLSVSALHQDREANLWIGTHDRGLVRLSRPPFVPLAPIPATSLERPLSVLAARDGAIWVGAAGSLARLRGEDVRVFTPADGLGVKHVRTLWEDRAGVLWVGGNGARGNTSRFDGVTFRNYGRAEGQPPVSNTWTITDDPAGRLWVGTWSLYELVDGRLVAAPGARPDRNVFVVRIDRSGVMWAGTGHGLLRRDAAGMRYFTRADGLPDNLVRAIYEDAGGTLWFGTFHGLARYRDGRFEALGPAAGLFDQPVYGILEDARRRLWLCTPKGVLRVDRPAAPGARLSYVRYGRADGLPSDECTGEQGSSTVARAPDGRLYFVTRRGIGVLDPARLGPAALPTVHVDRLLVDGRPTDPSGSAPVGTRRRAIQIDYTAPSLSSATGLRFRHRLDGFDADWIDAGPRRSVRYTNLAPGSYRFVAAVGNEDGVWSEQPAALAFVIAPLWYETSLFRVALAATLILLGWAIHRWRLHIIGARHAAVLEERARLARDVHDTIVQDLLSVWMRLEALRRSGAAWPAAVTQPLDVLRSSVHAGLDEARRLLAELRSGDHAALDLVSALAEVAHRLADGTGTRVRVEAARADGAPPPGAEITRALLRIGQEAVANALRHAEAREITIDVGIEARRVRLAIRDDGRGFDPSAEPAPTTDGHFGLIGMRERVQGLGGQVTIESGPGRGTAVRVEIPRGGT